MPHRMLLADDSLTIQKVVELTFSDSGYELMAVGSGDKAVQALEHFNPDIVLADVVMPGLSGYDVCEHVKALAGGEFLRFLSEAGVTLQKEGVVRHNSPEAGIVTTEFNGQSISLGHPAAGQILVESLPS